MERSASQPSAAETAASGAADLQCLKLKQAATPPRLEDPRLLEYRYPREWPALVIGLVAIAAALALAFFLEQRVFVIVLVGIWLAMLVSSLQAATLNQLRGAEVTAMQFPAIHQIAEELRQRFAAPPTRVFVVRSPLPEAHALGIKAPYVIVLNSALLDSLDTDELRYQLGRQFGHIRLGHTRVMILLGGNLTMLPPLLWWAIPLRNIPLTWYQRAQVLSADRAGVLACGSVETALRTEIKLAVGNAQMAEVNPADLVEASLGARQDQGRLRRTLVIMQRVTPPLVQRIQAMVEWTGLPTGPARHPPD